MLTERARARFDDGDYGAAVVDFLQAYDLLEGHPRQAAVLNNIAVCYERMFRYDLALQYYERYLREGAEDAADRAEVQQVVAGLRGLLGKLRLTSNVPAKAWIGRGLQTEVPGEIWVPAGPHVIDVSARGHEPQRLKVQVAPRSLQTLHFELEPIPQYQGISPAYFWSGATLTVATLLTGTGFGVRALREHDKAQARFERDASSVTVKDHVEPIQKLALRSDLAFGTAALLGVGTLVLFFLTDWRASDRKGERVDLSIAPQADRRGLSLSVSGRL